MISGNMVGSYSQIGKTFILVDEDGNEITGVCVDNPVVFTANATEDIREGKVAATDEGVVTGSAVIPNYETYEGTKVIPNGSTFLVPMNEHYNYTKFQAIICNYNTSFANSVAADKVVINDNVYIVQSTDVLSTIVQNQDNSTIDFGITNTSGQPYLIRYFMYKELY